MLFAKFINKYYLKYAIPLILGILVLIAVDWIQLYIPQFTGDIVNRLSHGTLSPEDISIITRECLYIFLVGIGMFVGRILWRVFIFRTSTKISCEIRKEMFLKAEKLSVTYYHNNKVGAIMAWFTNDLETIEDDLGFGTVVIIDSIFLLTFTLIKMFQLDWGLTIITLIPVGFIIIWGALVEKVMSEKWTLRQKSFDEMYDYSQENFTGIRVIKAFVKENKEVIAFSKVARKNKDIEINAARVSVGFDVAIEIVIAIVFALILGIGGWFVLAAIQHNPVVVFGHTVIIDAGKLVEFIGYFDTLIWPLIALGQVVTMRAKGMASAKRISSFLNLEEEIHDEENALNLELKGKITFNHFFFTYPDRKDPSLEDITLEIQPGETVGVVGKIGCGKSTLVNSLLRLYNITPRSILLDDVDIMNIKIKDVHEQIALVPQDNFLFSDTIQNNINFYDENATIEDAENSAKFAAVHDNILEFDHQYDTITGERGVSLSGGQKQRISIARAYAKNAPILILDDAVSAVDLKTEETILENIKTLRKGKTTIVVASRVSTVSHLDKIIVLNEGKIEAFGTPKEVAKSSPTYQRIVFLQRLEKEVEGKGESIWKKTA